MEDQDIFLDNIKQKEIREAGKFLGIENDIKIEITSRMYSPYEIKWPITSKEFKTEKTSKFFFIAIAVAIFSMPAISILRHSSSVMISSLTPVIILLFVFIRVFLFDKDLNYKIFLDKNGILIKDKLYAWNEIYETAILTKGTGRGKTEYLLILSNDMKNYDKFSLRNFNGFQTYSIGFRIAKYIESFKDMA